MPILQKASIITALLFILTLHPSFGQSENQIIDYKTIVKVDHGKLFMERSYLIQINNKESDWISDIEIPYKDDDKIELVEAFIINAKGQIVRKLKKKEITTRSDISNSAFYEDDLVMTFKLKWSEYPYRIKYTYTKKIDDFIYVSHWFPVVDTDVPTNKASLRVELPHDYAVAIRHSGAFKYEVDTLSSTYIHQWSVNGVKPTKRETFSPPIQELIPHVTIVPKDFHYGVKGSFESWAAFGHWQAQIIEGLDMLPQSEKIKVDKLIEGITDQKEKIKILYHYLQDNTRYINVAIDIGGLKPYPASYVCSNRFGDCKALTIYMKALLNYVGIPSFYTTIYAGNNPVKVNESIPSQQFNHVILCVPVDGDTLWLENTANFFPYNYLGTFTQDRHGLLTDGKNSQLIKTPALQPEDVLERSIYNFNLTKDGHGTAIVSKDVKGRAFENYKSIEYGLTEKDQRLQMEENLPLNNYQVSKWKFTHADRDDRRLKLDLELQVKNQFRKLGGMIVLKPVALGLYDLERPESRKTEVRINYPRNKHDSVVYNLPFLDQYKPDIPEPVKLDSDYGIYEVHYTEHKDQIVLVRNLQLFSRNYTLEEYEDFFEFIQSIRDSHQQSAIVLNPL